MSSLVNIDKRKKDFLILGKGSIEDLDETSLTAEKEYSIHFNVQQKGLYKYTS